ncbi:DUF6366 family protein [Sporosarcina contaminans]|uniref:DUF6366 family protein n=1 Tax=Sporosarcina contaminans TaxID=633403 RepID=A0ABW3TYW3_9BACL
MSRDNETPEQRREKLRQRELRSPLSSIHGSNLSDLVGGLGWKGTVVIVLILIATLVVYSLLF